MNRINQSRNTLYQTYEDAKRWKKWCSAMRPLMLNRPATRKGKKFCNFPRHQGNERTLSYFNREEKERETQRERSTIWNSNRANAGRPRKSFSNALGSSVSRDNARDSTKATCRHKGGMYCTHDWTVCHFRCTFPRRGASRELSICARMHQANAAGHAFVRWEKKMVGPEWEKIK